MTCGAAREGLASPPSHRPLPPYSSPDSQSLTTAADVTSLHLSPETLTYLKTRFIARDIPAKKQPSSSWMYYRKVFVFQRPIFMIWRSV